MPTNSKPVLQTRRQIRGANPPRSLGRLSDYEWELLRHAAAESGKSFTLWALDHLMPAAKRELAGKGGPDHG